MAEYIVRESGYPGTIKQEIVGELVRCKDCKRWDTDGYTAEFNLEGLGWCDRLGRDTHKGWFCADGEVREDER